MTIRTELNRILSTTGSRKLAITTATLEVFQKAKKLVSISKKIPSYFLDYKDIFRVFSGIGLMSAHKCQGVDELFRLWVHELMRVFGDKFETDVMRLNDNSPREELLKSIKSSSCQHLRQRVEQYMSHLISPGQSSLQARDLRNLFFCNFVSHEHKYYDEVTNTTSLMADLKNLTKQHASTYSIPDSCILFKYALECISSVVRAFQKDKGHVVMVGVNGSGRKTILKLAAMVVQLNIYQIESDSNYDIEQWQNELKNLLMTAGMGNKQYVLLLSDDQLRDERYFDHINTIMSTGDISYIYNSEEKSSILNKMMDLAHEEGSKIDTAPATMYNFFIERLKRNLHIAIVMNPANPFYFNRLHMIPCILKCSSFIWSSSWPEDALEEFANEMLQKTSLSEHPQLLKDGVKFCKIIHQSAIRHTDRYNEENKSNFYVSSHTYIKFLSTFHTLYKNKIEEISSKKNRYKQGLEKLNFTADQVVQMQNELQILKPKLLVTSDATEKLMIKIEQNTVNIETAKEIVAADEALANEAAAASQAIRDDCESDLSEAEPALFSATNALNTLKSSDITVIKAMKNPPSIVKLVLEAVCVMKAMKPELKTEVTGVTMEDYWPSSLKLLSDAKFLENLKYYDKENIDSDIMSTIRER
ncbi:dynein axonemal heavy chain 3-like [Planococcus citri]|uniref:dynein axonemal heavy chain 3-like n=1 Tax=Planococcus citri TaxID=170843 RepID=UPI0031F92CE6